MTTFEDIKKFIKAQNYNRFIIAADAETRVSTKKNSHISSNVTAGGVGVALDPVARASNAVYIARGRTDEEKILSNSSGKIEISDPSGSYTLKRLFFSKEELDAYYYGFSNQTLWPLCHVSFEKPEFSNTWFDGFKKVNQKFAQSIKQELKGRTFLWVNDYQLCLVPKYLANERNLIIGMFWHIPWPTWEVFRILPFKKEILESLLSCDFLAFHRGYQVRNFLETVNREFEVRIDEETSRVYFNKHAIVVKNLPMGIDADVIESIVKSSDEDQDLEVQSLRKVSSISKKEHDLSVLFDKYKVILGVDRLDYTKGLLIRLQELDLFFEKNPIYRGKVVYVGIIAPSREKIPAYKLLKKEIELSAKEINQKYKRNGWNPIHIIYDIFPRSEIMRLYKHADVCLVTPLDDGMNLVSKEFVIAASYAENPGMLVLSQFAGSSIDLTASIIVNPYDKGWVVNAIRRALEMSREEKVRRIKNMSQTLKDKNIYEWAEEFIKSTISAAKHT